MAIDAALGRLGIKEGVCTSSTRPANPFEGQLIYETDTNRTLVYDNAAWLVVADNQVLSIDSANGRVGVNDTSPSYALDVTGDINATGVFRAGGTEIIGLGLISSATLSGATTTFSSIPATFKSLRVVLDDVIVSDASVAVLLQLNNDTGSNYTQLAFVGSTSDSFTARQYVSTGNYTAHLLSYNNIRGAAGSGGGDRQNQFVVDLPNYSQAVAYKNTMVQSVYFGAGAGAYESNVLAGSWRNVAAITEIDINVSAGTFTSGTAYLYGY